MKKTILLSLFAILYSLLPGKAQAPNWAWANSAGGTSDDYGHSVTTDVSGNVFMTGFFQSPTITFGTTTLTNVDTTGNTEDIFIAKYDAAGNVLWAKSAGGIYNDRGNIVSTDASGNVFITGFFTSPTINFGTTTLTNAGSYNIFITKYDAAGNVLWAKSAGGAGGDVGNSVSTDASGNVFLTGPFNSPTITFGTTTLTNVGNADIFIAKYDAAGNVLWAKSVGGTSIDVGISVATDASGNVLMTGYFQSPTITFGTTTLTNAGISSSSDIFIAKYDAAGNVLWAKSAGGTDYDDGNSVSTDASGNVFLTGYFNSPTITFGTTTLTNAGGSINPYDIFIAKYDATGNVLWAKSAGGTSVDEGASVSTDASGNVLMTGLFQSPTITFGTTTLTNTGVGPDIFIAKYDATGNVLWAKSVGGTSYDVGYSVATDASGNVFMTGYFGSPIITFGTTTLTNAGGSGNIDIFIAKLDITTSIQEFQGENLLSIYPNPATSLFTITFTEPQKNTSIKIMDVLGCEILKQVQNDQSAKIDISGFAKGIYFVRIEDSTKNVVNRKIVVE